MIAFSSSNDNPSGTVLDNHMSVQDAAEYSGYNTQYLRRLVRTGKVKGVRIGQMWLVEIASLDAHLKSVRQSEDRRCGPRVYQAYMREQEE